MDKSKKGKQTPAPFPKEIHMLGPMDLKIDSLERNPRLWLDSWQDLETFAKIVSVTSISVKFPSAIILHIFSEKPP